MDRVFSGSVFSGKVPFVLYVPVCGMLLFVTACQESGANGSVPLGDLPPQTGGRSGDANREATGGESSRDNSQATAQPSPAAAEGAVVELSDQRVRIDERGIFWFGVKYRFTKGQPRKNYLLKVTFPGTQNLCLKHMEAWQLQSAGEIRDGIPLVEQPLKSYEIDFSEAESPMSEYVRISNVVSELYVSPRVAADGPAVEKGAGTSPSKASGPDRSDPTAPPTSPLKNGS